MKRILSLFLSLIMIVTMLPVQALAEETQPTQPAEVLVEAPMEMPEASEATEATKAAEITEATEAVEETEATEATQATEPQASEEATEETLPAEKETALAPPPEWTEQNQLQTFSSENHVQPYVVSGNQNVSSPSKAQIQQMFYQVTSTKTIFAERPSVRAPYKAGSLTADMLNSGLSLLNYIRFIANLPLVSLDADMNNEAQHGAVLMAAIDTLSHTPAKPRDMDDAFYQIGYGATSSSNISYNYGYAAVDSLQIALLGCIDDEDTSNFRAVGHRRWLLHPDLKNVGFGYAQSASGSNYSTTKVFGGNAFAGNDAPLDYQFVAWPASGNFPSHMLYKTVPWSISLNPAIYATPQKSQITITMTRKSDGKVWTFNSATPEPSTPSGAYLTVNTAGYGRGSCIIFHPDAASVGTYNGIYSVDVSGLKLHNGSQTSIHYDVDFFDVVNYVPPAAPLDEGTCGKAITWQIYPDGTLSLSGSGAMEFDGSGKAPWSAYTDMIRSVEIGEGITGIVGGAFAQCKNLKQVTLPDTIASIGRRAFAACTSLPEITLPSQLLSIGEEAFDGCIRLATIYFHGSAPSFENNCFRNVCATLYYPAGSPAWKPEVMVNYGGTLLWLANYGQRYVYDISAQKTEVLAGESINLRALVTSGSQSSGKICWTVSGPDGCASITGTGETAVFRASNVTEKQTVTVTAFMESGDLPTASISIHILPKAEEVRIFSGSSDVTGSSLSFDLNRIGPNGQPNRTLTLSSVSYPSEASQGVTWTSSSKKIAAVSANGLVTFTGTAGTVKITATSDSRKATASVTIKAAALPQKLSLQQGDLSIIGGKSTTFKAMDCDTGKVMTAAQIQWSLNAGAEPYATIHAKTGKLTTKKVAEQVTVIVTGSVIGGEGKLQQMVTIYPTATLADLRLDSRSVADQSILFDSSDPAETMMLSVIFHPDEVMDLPAVWTISDAKKIDTQAAGKFASYTINKAENTLTISKPTGKTGTVTIKAAAADGSGKSASVKLQFGVPAVSLTIGRKAGKQIVSEEHSVLVGGKSLQLAATLLASDPGHTPTNQKVSWHILQGSAYAKVSASGTVTTSAVYEEKTVVIQAVSQSDSRINDTYTLTLQPKDRGILILRDAAGKNVTKTTIPTDISAPVSLKAFNLSDGSQADVTWKSSNAKVAAVDKGTVTFKQAGTVTITATATDRRTAAVTIKASSLAKEVIITSQNGFVVASGKSLSLKADVPGAAVKGVTWSILSGEAFAKLTQTGKLTAVKNLTTSQTVKIRATAKDGSGANSEVSVTIRPLATGVQIYSRDTSGITVFQVDSSNPQDSLGIVRSNTTYVHDMQENNTLQLNAKVYPFYGTGSSRNAIQRVTWKSSSPKIASVNDDGLVTCMKPGTVTITATAADGSGQKVTFKLTVVKRIQRLDVTPDVELSVKSGKTLNLSKLIVIDPVDATNKKLTWKITGGNAYATLSSTGTLKAKKVTSSKTVQITASAQDGSGAAVSFRVRIIAN